jgi:hypothetical protein
VASEVLRSSDSKIPECPICTRGDRTDKASSVVRQNSGTVLIASAAPSSFETQLGSQLARPQEPDEPSWTSTAIHIAFSWLMAAFIFGTVAFIESLASLSAPEGINIAVLVAVIWFGLVTPAIRVVRTLQKKAAFPAAFSAWRRADGRWSNLYYCSRDDVCFIEGENEWRQPEHVQALLYSLRLASVEVKGLAPNPGEAQAG